MKMKRPAFCGTPVLSATLLIAFCESVHLGAAVLGKVNKPKYRETRVNFPTQHLVHPAEESGNAVFKHAYERNYELSATVFCPEELVAVEQPPRQAAGNRVATTTHRFSKACDFDKLDFVIVQVQPLHVEYIVRQVFDVNHWGGKKIAVIRVDNPPDGIFYSKYQNDNRRRQIQIRALDLVVRNLVNEKRTAAKMLAKKPKKNHPPQKQLQLIYLGYSKGGGVVTMDAGYRMGAVDDEEKRRASFAYQLEGGVDGMRGKKSPAFNDKTRGGDVHLNSKMSTLLTVAGVITAGSSVDSKYLIAAENMPPNVKLAVLQGSNDQSHDFGGFEVSAKANRTFFHFAKLRSGFGKKEASELGVWQKTALADGAIVALRRSALRWILGDQNKKNAPEEEEDDPLEEDCAKRLDTVFTLAAKSELARWRQSHNEQRKKDLRVPKLPLRVADVMVATITKRICQKQTPAKLSCDYKVAPLLYTVSPEKVGKKRTDSASKVVRGLPSTILLPRCALRRPKNAAARLLPGVSHSFGTEKAKKQLLDASGKKGWIWDIIHGKDLS